MRSDLREARTRHVAITVSVIVVLACVLWAAAVQVLLPDACSYDTPPENAQYLHC